MSLAHAGNASRPTSQGADIRVIIRSSSVRINRPDLDFVLLHVTTEFCTCMQKVRVRVVIYTATLSLAARGALRPPGTSRGGREAHQISHISPI